MPEMTVGQLNFGNAAVGCADDNTFGNDDCAHRDTRRAPEYPGDGLPFSLAGHEGQALSPDPAIGDGTGRLSITVHVNGIVGDGQPKYTPNAQFSKRVPQWLFCLSSSNDDHPWILVGIIPGLDQPGDPWFQTIMAIADLNTDSDIEVVDVGTNYAVLYPSATFGRVTPGASVWPGPPSRFSDTTRESFTITILPDLQSVRMETNYTVENPGNTADIAYDFTGAVYPSLRLGHPNRWHHLVIPGDVGQDRMPVSASMKAMRIGNVGFTVEPFGT